MTPSYTLADVDLRHERDPEHFQVLPLEARRRLRKGMRVKLVFEPVLPSEDGPSGERMWVEIDEVSGDGEDRRYRGTLLNTPVVFHRELRHGDRISFGPEHVADVDRPAPPAR